MRSFVRAAFEVRGSDGGGLDAGLTIAIAKLIAARRDFERGRNYERGRTGLVRFARPVITLNKWRAHGHRASLDNLSDHPR